MREINVKLVIFERGITFKIWCNTCKERVDASVVSGERIVSMRPVDRPFKALAEVRKNGKNHLCPCRGWWIFLRLPFITTCQVNVLLLRKLSDMGIIVFDLIICLRDGMRNLLKKINQNVLFVYSRNTFSQCLNWRIFLNAFVIVFVLGRYCKIFPWYCNSDVWWIFGSNDKFTSPFKVLQNARHFRYQTAGAHLFTALAIYCTDFRHCSNRGMSLVFFAQQSTSSMSF